MQLSKNTFYQIFLTFAIALISPLASADGDCGKGNKRDARNGQCREKCGTHKEWSYKTNQCVHASTRCREEGGTWLGQSCQSGNKAGCESTGGLWLGLSCQHISGNCGLNISSLLGFSCSIDLTPTQVQPISGSVPTPFVMEWLDIPYDQVAFLGAHNAFASTEHGYMDIWANQSASVPHQLSKYAARVLEYDIYKYGADKIHICHNECGSAKANSIRNGFKGNGEDFGKFLGYVRDFIELTNSPSAEFFSVKQAQAFLGALRRAVQSGNDDELRRNGWSRNDYYKLLRAPPIITIMLEDNLNSSSADRQLIDTYIAKAGLDPYVLSNSDWNLTTEKGWPSVASMIESGKTIVIFSGEAATPKYVRHFWNIGHSNKYPSEASRGSLFSSDEFNPNQMCKELRGNGPDSWIMEMKFQPYIGTKYKVSSDTAFSLFFENCMQFGVGKLKQRAPNFVMIDNVNTSEIFNRSMKRILDVYLGQLQQKVTQQQNPKLASQHQFRRLERNASFNDQGSLSVEWMKLIYSNYGKSKRDSIDEDGDYCRVLLSRIYPDNGLGYYNVRSRQCQTPAALTGCSLGSEYVTVRGISYLRCKGGASPTTCKNDLSAIYPNDNNLGYYNPQYNLCQTPQALAGCPLGTETVTSNGVVFARCKADLEKNCTYDLHAKFSDNGNGYFNKVSKQCQTPDALNGCLTGTISDTYGPSFYWRCK
jgi:hypothetical protein